MFKKFKQQVLTAAVTAILVGPGAANAAGEKIIASFHNMAEPFFVVMTRELKDEAKKLNVDVTVVDGQANSAKQTADVENALVQGVKGIIIAPTDVKALTPAVNEVIKAGVPIVTVDRYIEGASKAVPHVGADNVAGGRGMVDWVVKNYPGGAKIVLLTGQPGSSSAIDRTKGVHQGVTKAGAKYKIVVEQTANWARDQGLTVTQNILTSLGKNRPDVIIAENDMALGAIEALRESGADKAGVKVMGFDAVPDALKKVRDGSLASTVEQSPSRQIRTALQQIVAKIREGKEIQSKSIEPVLITAQNLKDAERLSEVK